MFNIQAIEQALREGCRLHTFRSGGGLRVVRIENEKNELKGYGEHPALEEALVHANENCVDNLTYEQQYNGDNAKYPHYLTGSTHSSTELDAWVKAGHNFDAHFETQEGCFVVELKGYAHQHTPEEIQKRVIKTGQPEEWKDKKRGYTFLSEPFTFPGNGEAGCSTKVIGTPEGKEKSDPWMYEIVKTGFSATSLWEAISNAFIAEEVEVENK